MRTSLRDWAVAGLGAAVTTAGALTMRSRRRGRLGSGILGFGLAHVVLAMLDRVTGARTS